MAIFGLTLQIMLGIVQYSSTLQFPITNSYNFQSFVPTTPRVSRKKVFGGMFSAVIVIGTKLYQKKKIIISVEASPLNKG
jgi:hypothetical protein